MSKSNEANWITLSITVTPDDFMELQDAIADIQWHSGARSGLMEHIVEQYQLKMEELKPSTFDPIDFEFLKEMVALGKTSEGQRIMTTSSYFMNRIIDLHDKYGKERINKTIDTLKKHEAMHKAVQTSLQGE